MLIASVTTASALSWWQALAAAGILAVVALLAGFIVIYGRSKFVGTAKRPKGPAANPSTRQMADQAENAAANQLTDGTAVRSASGSDGDFIRSWIAIILVIGLLSFCAFAFAINDTTLRSALVGGLVASVGSAIAFYFSSKAADKARQDIANATTLGTELVPSLIGKTKVDAAQILGHTSFSLIEEPGSSTGSERDVVRSQNPPANSSAPRGSSVMATFGAIALPDAGTADKGMGGLPRP